MTLDQLHRRDARIAVLDASGPRGRTRADDHELGRLLAARDQHWRRLPAALAAARRRAADLDAYARQHRFPLA